MADRTLTLNHGTTGLTGTLSVKILASDGATVLVAETTAGVLEFAQGQYLWVYDNGSSVNGIIVWDDQTADPITSEAFEARVTGGGGSGITGPSDVSLTWQDADDQPVASVPFVVVGVGSSSAGSSGVAEFGLPDGTYTIVSAPTNGVIFPDFTLEVDGDTVEIIPGSTPAPQTPTAPGKCWLSGYTRNASVAADPSRDLRFRLLSKVAGTGSIFSDPEVTVTSNSLGYFTVELAKSAKYDIFIEGLGKHGRVTTGTEDNQICPDLYF